MPDAVYPRLPTDNEPSLEELNAHNLAMIAESLQALTSIAERISGHLFDMKRGRNG